MPTRQLPHLMRWIAAGGLTLLATEALAQECTALESLAIEHTEITRAAPVAAGQFTPPGGGRFGAQTYAGLPAFCRIEIVSRPAPGSAIGIEVWLPLAGWNGKLEGVGNGAWAGSISHSAMAGALAAGFAVTSTDTGHIGNSIGFARENEDKQIDFAFRAVHEMTVIAKALVTAFYERPAERAYFAGCSTGGRQALTEAQRFPGDYDGIVAGAPAYYPTHIQGMQVWTAAVSNRSDAARLDSDDFALVNRAAISACDANDGVRDGVLEDPRTCAFDPAELACNSANAVDCLTPEQVATVRSIYAGPTLPNGTRVFPGLERGSETGWTTLSGTEPLTLALDTFATLTYGDAPWDWRAFDPATDIANAEERIGPLMDSNDADLSDFVARGGRLLLYHGWSDPGIPPGGTVLYYDNVLDSLGPATADDHVRLFMVPGMGHCAGGTGTDRFDAVAALDRWVETGNAPERIEAERVVGGERVRTRPLCPYPAVATFDGNGSTDEAASFSCR
jgi:feruloyl esterase